MNTRSHKEESPDQNQKKHDENQEKESAEGTRKRSVERTYETSDESDEDVSIPKSHNNTQDTVTSQDLDQTIGYTLQNKENENEEWFQEEDDKTKEDPQSDTHSENPQQHNPQQPNLQDTAARLLDDTMVTDSMLLSAGITQNLSAPLFTSTLEEEPAKGDEPDEPEDPEPPEDIQTPVKAEQSFEGPNLRRRPLVDYEALNSGKDSKDTQKDTQKCTKCKTFENQLMKAQSENTKLKMKESMWKRTEQENARLKMEKDNTDSLRNKMEQENARLKTSMGKVTAQKTDATKELDKTKKELKEEQLRMKALEEKVKGQDNKIKYDHDIIQQYQTGETRLNGRIKQLETEQQQEQNKQATLQDKIKQLETEQQQEQNKQATVQDKIKQLETENQKLKNDNNELEDAATTLRDKLTETQNEKEKEIDRKNTLINDLIITRNSLLKTLTQLQNQKPDQKGKTPAEEAQQEKPKNKPLMLTDSNGLRSATKIRERMNDNIQLTPTYNTDELKEFASNTPAEDLKDRDIIILCGTNNIRKMEKATEIAKNIKEATEILKTKGAKVKITQVPPLALPGLNKETLKLNGIIEAEYEDKVISLDKMYDTRDILDDDKIHLNGRGQTMLADIINKKMITRTVPGKKPAPKDNMKSYLEITLGNEVAGHVIGREGKTIQGLKAKHKAEINTRHRDQKTVLELTGTEKQIQEIKEEVEEMKKRAEVRIAKRQQIKEKRGKINCMYFQSGTCQHGNQCDFRHEYGPLEKSTRTVTRSQSPNYEALEGAVGYTFARERQPRRKSKERRDSPREGSPRPKGRRQRSPSEDSWSINTPRYRSPVRPLENWSYQEEHRSRSPTRYSKYQKREESRDRPPSTYTSTPRDPEDTRYYEYDEWNQQQYHEPQQQQSQQRLYYEDHFYY